MKVLHVLDHSLPVADGYAYRTAAIIRGQRRAGIDTVHVTSAKHVGDTARESAEGLDYYRTAATAALAGVPVVNQLDVVWTLRRRLEEVVAAEGPDLIHCHSPSLTGLAALPVAARHGLPLVYEVRAFWEDAAVDHGTSSEQGLRYRLTAASETRVLRRADAVFTICEGLKDAVIQRGISAEKVTVVPNGVDTAGYEATPAPDAEIRARHGLDDKFVAGFIGSFYAWEGVDMLVEAVAALKDRLPHLRLLLVGGGNEGERLERQARDLGVAERVIFVGRVPHAEVDRYYSVTDVLCLPRKSMRLTELVTPLKPLEAMLRRVPCLASDVGGHRELIRPGETGFLFEAGNVTALADKLARLATDPRQCRSVVEPAYEFVLAQRDWQICVDRGIAVYERLLANRRPQIRN